MMIKRPLFVIICTVVAALCWETTVHGQKLKQIHIAFIGPLTGIGDSFGEAAKAGIELAFKESKGSNGIEVTFHDDMLNPRKAVSIFEKLTTTKKPDLIISLGNQSALALSPLAQRAKIPLIAWTGDPRVSTAHPFIMRSNISEHREGFADGDEIKRQKFNRIAVVYALNDYSRSVYEGAMQRIDSDQLVLNTSIAPDIVDFSELIAKFKAATPSSFFLCINSTQWVDLINGMRAAGFTGPIMGCRAIKPLNIATNSKALSGVSFLDLPIALEFRNKIRAQVAGEQELEVAAIHYDLIHTALAAFKTRQREESLIDAMFRVQFQPQALEAGMFLNDVADQYLELKLQPIRIGASK